MGRVDEEYDVAEGPAGGECAVREPERTGRTGLNDWPAHDPTTEIFLEQERYLRSLALRILNRPEDVDDVIQITWIKFHKGFANYTPDASIATWLARIAVNASLDLLRARRRRQGVSLQDDGDEVEAGLADILVAAPWGDPQLYTVREAIHREIAAGLRGLAAAHPARAICFEMHYLSELGIETVAGRLGIPEGTVKSHLYYARLYLRTHHSNLEHLLAMCVQR